jgi:ribosomal protein S18 acetylase RimI-like enzyme
MKIRSMTEQDLDAVVEITVKGFAVTDFYRYIAPDEAQRFAFLNVMFHGRIRGALTHSDIDLAAENGDVLGAATWVPPQTAPVHQTLQASYNPAFDALPEDVRTRWQNFTQTLSEAREKSLQQPFWSLSPIVVSPKAQGKGIASLLIRKKLAEIDTAPLPCFLATQDPKNRDIYAHYGFAVTSEDRLGASEIISYTMVRPAQT